jgi:hypothetical protein
MELFEFLHHIYRNAEITVTDKNKIEINADGHMYDLTIVDVEGFDISLIGVNETTVYLDCHFENEGTNYNTSIIYYTKDKTVTMQVDKLVNNNASRITRLEEENFMDKLEIAKNYLMQKSNYRLDFIVDKVKIQEI